MAARASRWRGDLAWVAVATLASYLLASAFELQESLTHRLQRFERWQADELPLSLTVLSGGLAWYALRRRRELRDELRLREQAEQRVADVLAHNRHLAQQLIAAQERERLALARELHDELGQSCTAIRIETSFLRHCAADDHAGLLASAARADQAAQGLYGLVRDLLGRLRPADLDTLGLTAALQALCEGWQRRTGVACAFDARGEFGGLGDVIDITVFRVVQEALTNVARHANARRVQVELRRDGLAWLHLAVQDDGRGMDVAAATRGLGLLGAVERAAAVGGALDISSPRGAGVRIALRVPLAAAGVAA